MKRNFYPGKFISVDGIDGSGKTTQIKFIEEWFKKKGLCVKLGKEPSDGIYGKKIREILEGRIFAPKDPFDFQRLFIKDRKDHIKKDILPWITKDKNVYITDRYILSTLAYGMAEGVDYEGFLKEHENILKDDFIIPDFMIVLALDSDEALKRIKNRNKGDLNLEYFEKKKEVLKKANDAFLFLSNEFENVEVVFANDSIYKVSEKIKNILESKYEK